MSLLASNFLVDNTVSVNFWDNKIWMILVQLGIIFISILFANILRRKIKFIKRSLLPTSVIAGTIIFILKFIPFVNKYINQMFMEGITYHFLALGFIAVGLKTTVKAKQEKNGVILNTGLFTVNAYLVQAIVGIVLTIALMFTICKGLFPATGLLLPMGFGQGTGQALNIGGIFEENGFENGKAFGLSVAALGFFVACIVGVIYLNVLKKKGKLKLQEDRKEKANNLNSDIYSPDEAPLTDSVDKLTIQVAFVLLVYMMTFGLIFGLSKGAEQLGNFGVKTIKPLLWGFNFLFGSLLALLVKKIIAVLRNKKIMKYNYVNNYMMNRLSGLFFDVMVVAGIAAINWGDLEGLLIPLLVICITGGILTFIYCRFVSNKLYKGYEHETFFAMFGMLTGTASTGMILLRELDPNYETPAADNLVLQQVPATVFGAPILLVMSFAAQGLTQTLITLGIATGLFVIYNIIMFRKFIFKRKNKTNKEEVSQ